MKSVSVTPIFRSVSRMVGQVPSPTPMGPTSGDSSSVTCSPLPEAARCSAAMTPAVSHPADPPPTITTCFTASLTRPARL